MSLRDLPRSALLTAVRGYRYWLRPWMGNVCRFEPSCSDYAMQALKAHGAVRGTSLATGRILRCHPWCEGGHDPVPEQFHLPRLPGTGLFTRLLSRREAAPADTRTLTRKIP